MKERQKLVSELCKQCAWQAGESHEIDSDQFLVTTQVQSHALLRLGFGTSVSFIAWAVIQ